LTNFSYLDYSALERTGVFDLEVLALAVFYGLASSTAFGVSFVFCTFSYAYLPALLLLLFEAGTTGSSTLDLIGDLEGEFSLDRFLLEPKKS
jgi:hypothetical protein